MPVTARAVATGAFTTLRNAANERTGRPLAGRAFVQEIEKALDRKLIP